MKKMKKLTALLLTLVMSLALAVPCFAAEPADDAVWLEVGDSYTVGGYTITIKEDTRTPAQREAERQALLQEALTRGFQIGGRYYFLKAEEYQYTSPWTYTTRCNASYGDTLHYDISNYSKEQRSEFTFSLQMGNEKPANVTVAPGQSITPEVYAEESTGIYTPIKSTFTPVGGRIWFSISIYQYWR